MSLINIKPCPFCGEEAHLFRATKTEEGDCFGAYVFCTECQSSSPVCKTDGKAVKVWNTRAHQDEPALFTKIKSLIEYLEEKSYGAEIAYLTYGEAEDRAEHCAYKDAARRLREIAEGKNGA